MGFNWLKIALSDSLEIVSQYPGSEEIHISSLEIAQLQTA
jgi:hypothetical protein